MNRPIRTLSIGCLILFVALLLNITYVQFFKADDYNDRADNRRVIQASFSRQRGAILAGKQAIAKSVKSKDQYQWQRTYPKPFEYAPITGFLSYQFGQSAIESSQNDVLSGDDDRLFTNRLIDLVTNSEPEGGNVETTINPKVQDAAYNGLTALGSDVEGAAVAIEPSTGRILAMASTPSYNPNNLATHDLNKAAATWKKLDGAGANGPMQNRVTRTALPPGSTFKLVTAAAALEDLKMTPDSLVNGTNRLDVPQTDKDMHNENGTTCGNLGRSKVSFTTALDWSCNVSFGEVALKLTDAQLREQAEKFGFGQHYLDDLSQATSRFPDGTLGPAFRVQSAIGQYDVAATPLQMAMVSAGIANGGTVMKPYLVDRVTSASLDVIDQGHPEPLSGQPAISSKTADQLTTMMQSVVDHGTGTPARIPGVAVAGKTGTAQSDPNRPPYAWFTAFAPAENPKIAVAVMVQKSGTARNDIAGGALCAPIAKSMIEAAIGQ
ncbi:peptidoglycan D,D-transpeptidase FtsI family protein [Nocardioides sp. DS6]|uniref:Peptidoglycan D,D-transpeptidase FtsI family protein n=1 Tax=Nocardioides eburneus TaxID=3231482 RepID=A0ABV3T263_9ACTN